MKQALNFILFSVGWTACVAGAGQGFAWLGPVLLLPLLGIQYALTPDLRREWRFLALLAVLGIVLDSLFALSGMLQYQPFPWGPPLAPLWIGALWVMFGTTLGRSLSWLAERPALAALLGLLGGPISYFAGQRLGAVSFGVSPALALSLVGIAWAIAMPALYRVRDLTLIAPQTSVCRAPVVLVILLVAAASPATLAKGDPEVVDYVDLERYAGKWYEIASIPNMFQRNCFGTIARYEMREDGTMEVINSCRKGSLEEEPSSTTGVARVKDETSNAKLRVSFFWPLSVSYWIIDLDPNYKWAVVGTPSRNYLWVISREPAMDEKLYQQILARAAAQGFDVSELQRTPQLPAGHANATR